MNAGRALILALLLAAGVAQAAVTASVDRNRISVSDSLVLTLRATEGEAVEDTSLDALALDFDVVSTGTSTRMSITNGRTERTTELQVVLLPRRSGELLIPPLMVDGNRTREIPVLVSDAPAGLDNSRDVFVESEVDRDSVYVQSQLIHTFRIYEAVDLSDRGRSELKLEEAVVEELDGSTFQRVIEGRAYRVYEVRHAIFPQKSGTLTIPSLSFNARKPAVRRSMFARGELVRRRSDPIIVEVKPVPASWPDAPWIPAAGLKLEESWSTLPDRLEIGDSVTRTITVIAEGIDGSQLPPVTQAEIPGIKMYPDQPRSENTRNNDGVTGIGINSTALLITEPGEFLLPPVRVPWWDTNSNTLRYAEIPAKQIRVAGTVAAEPATGIEATTATATPAADPVEEPLSLWMWSTLAALLGWLGTTSWLLWRMRRGRPAAPVQEEDAREAELFRACLAACNSNQPRQARSALQDWGRRYFDDASPPTLQLLQQRLDSEELGPALEALERSLYAGAVENWQGADLALALKKCRQRRRAHDKSSKAPLPPLYGSS